MSGNAKRWAWVWLPVAFWVMCAGWALTSPPGSSPDDDYHLSSIWCAGGIRQGACEEVVGDPSQRLVPRNVVQAADCFRFDGSVNAGCTSAIRDDTTLVATDRVNDIAGLYPTGYYRVMSIFVGPDVERSVLMMRLLNASLVAFLLALLLRLVPGGVRAATAIALTVTFIPLGLFVVASTNPSGWASAGVLLFWGFAVSLVARADWRNRRTWLIALGAGVAGGMAIASRVDASAYLVVAVALALIPSWRPSAKATWISAAVVIAIGAAGMVGYVLHPTPGAGAEGTMGTADRGAGLLFTNAAYLPALFQGIVGGGALGWNDTVMPPLIPIAGVLVVGGLTWAGLSVMWVRKAVACLLGLVALVSIPLWFLQKEGLGVGEVVQPRYLLPLLSLLVGTLLLVPRAGRPIALSRIPLASGAVVLSVSAVLAFWANAHRYAAGSSVGLFDPKMQPAWTNGSHVPFVLITALAVVATVVWVLGSLLVVAHTRPTRSQPVGS